MKVNKLVLVSKQISFSKQTFLVLVSKQANSNASQQTKILILNKSVFVSKQL